MSDVLFSSSILFFCGTIIIQYAQGWPVSFFFGGGVIPVLVMEFIRRGLFIMPRFRAVIYWVELI